MRMVIVGEFFKKVVFPVILICLLLLLFKPIHMSDGKMNYLYMWILVGIFWGMKRMCMWLIPGNYGIDGTVWIIALNFIIGGLIGGVIAAVYLVQAVYYCLRSLITIAMRATD